MVIQRTLKRSTGWILLLVGILIIFWSLYSSYNIFTAKTPAPEIFKEKEEKVLSPEVKPGDLEAQMEKMIGEQLKGILPADSIPQLLNLISWSIFAGILIFGGTQISGLGIKLIKR